MSIQSKCIICYGLPFTLIFTQNIRFTFSYSGRDTGDQLIKSVLTDQYIIYAANLYLTSQ